MRNRYWTSAALGLLVVTGTLTGCQAPSPAAKSVQVDQSPPLRYNSPDEALKALLAATQQRDRPQLRKIFGVELGEM